MLKKYFLWMMLSVMALGLKGQEVIIGTGTNSSYSMAFYQYYEDSWWESLYLAQEVGMSGNITSIALHNTGGGTLQCQNVRIYMGHRSQSMYSSTSAWTPMSDLTLVYSATNSSIGSNSSGWETFTLNTPFFYNGSDNLVVVFAKHANDYSSDFSYYYSETADYSSLYRYMDDDEPYSLHPGTSSGSRSFYRPNIKLNITPNANFCGSVNNLQVTNIAMDEATLSWGTAFNPHTYIVDVKTASQSWSDPNVISYSTSDTFLLVTGLSASSSYDVRVANDCIDDTSTYKYISFYTDCGPMSALPLQENFDSYTHTSNNDTGPNNLPNCWAQLNTGSSYSACPYVYYSSSNSYSGNYCMRFYTATGSAYSDQYAFLPTLDLSAVSLQNLTMGLYMRRSGNNNTFRLVVGVTSGTDVSTFTPIDTLTSNSSTYAYKTVSFASYVGSGDRVVLMAPKNNGNNRGFVDDIVLGSDLCASPTNLSVSAADEYSITLQWNETGTATSWDIEYGPAGFATGSGTVVSANSNPFVITGLDPASTYEFQVRSDCGSSTSEWSNSRAIGSTNCLPLTTIPYTQNFNGYTHTNNSNTGDNNLPNCWNAYNTGSSYSAYPYVYYSNNNSYSGNYALRFYVGNGSGYSSQYAALPAFDSSIPLNTLQISFKARADAASTPFTLIVGAMSGGTNTFTPIDTLTISGTSYGAYEVYLDTYTGTGDRIALMAPKPSSGNNRGYVDDVVVSVLSTCRMVSNVVVSDITTTDAVVSWQSNGTESSWIVEYRVSGNNNPWQTVTATTNPYLLTGLTNATNYQVRVSADCGTETSGSSANVAFTTLMCDSADRCTYTFVLTDSYGDGWNGAALAVRQNGINVTSMTVSSSATTATYQVALCDSLTTTLVWTSGDYDYECSFELRDPFGEVIYTGSDPNSGTIYTFTTNCTLPACPRPLSVTVSDIGATSVEVSWVSTGSESSWNLEYKPANSNTWTVETVSTNPYVLTNLVATTLYDIRVQADCGDTVSDYRVSSFQTNACEIADQCTFNISMNDSYGDGWNTATLTVMQDGLAVANITLDDGYSGTASLALCDNATISLVWTSATFDDEVDFTVTAPYGATLYSVTYPSNGTLVTFTAHCTAPTCLAPSAITVSNIGTSSADVSWVPVGNETAWNLEYKTASDASWTVIPVTTTTYTLTNLTLSTAYDVRVQADCGNGDLSDYESATFSTSACEVIDQCAYIFTMYDDFEDGWNGGMLLVQQNNVTVASLTLDDFGYATATVLLCDNVSTSLVWVSGLYSFEASFSVTGPDGTILYTSPEMDQYSTYTFTTNCNGSTPTTCDAPTGLAVNNPAQTTATATWTAGGTETSWNVQYKTVAASSWQNATANATSYTMTGLVPNTTYQVRVQAVCDADMTSNWSMIISFTTAQGSQTCPAPTNLTAVLGESHTTVILNWQQEPNTANEWQVNYRQTTEDTWSTVTANATTYTLTDLVANVTYEFKVEAHCTNGLTSDASNTVSIQTDDVGVQSWLEKSVTLYPNPATEMIAIAVSDANIMITDVEVYNVYGQVVETFHGTSLQGRATLNVSGLADGMYYVRVTTDNGVVTKNFVKR